MSLFLISLSQVYSMLVGIYISCLLCVTVIVSYSGIYENMSESTFGILICNISKDSKVLITNWHYYKSDIYLTAPLIIFAMVYWLTQNLASRGTASGLCAGRSQFESRLWYQLFWQVVLRFHSPLRQMEEQCLKLGHDCFYSYEDKNNNIMDID
jgi:hypothetical protein